MIPPSVSVSFCFLLLALPSSTASLESTSASPVSSECPKGAARYERKKSCFWILEPRMTWTDAEAACVKNGGRLASVTDEYENAFAFDLARKTNLSVPTVWLGKLTHLSATGAYKWHDGAIGRLTEGFKGLLNQEPPSGSDICMSMWMDFEKPEGSWHEWDCEYALGYSALCKKQLRKAKGDGTAATEHTAKRCCVAAECGRPCSTNERCIPDDLNCLWKSCPGGGPGWCLPSTH